MTTMFKYFSASLLKRAIAGKIPSWITRNFLYQRIWHSFLKERNEVVLKFHEFLHKQIVSHRVDLDKNNPRDYLGNKYIFLSFDLFEDMLLIAADKEKRLGYDVVVATVLGIYLGASDTLAYE